MLPKTHLLPVSNHSAHHTLVLTHHFYHPRPSFLTSPAQPQSTFSHSSKFILLFKAQLKKSHLLQKVALTSRNAVEGETEAGESAGSTSVAQWRRWALQHKKREKGREGGRAEPQVLCSYLLEQFSNEGRSVGQLLHQGKNTVLGEAKLYKRLYLHCLQAITGYDGRCG